MTCRAVSPERFSDRRRRVGGDADGGRFLVETDGLGKIGEVTGHDAPAEQGLGPFERSDPRRQITAGVHLRRRKRSGAGLQAGKDDTFDGVGVLGDDEIAVAAPDLFRHRGDLAPYFVRIGTTRHQLGFELGIM